MAQAAVLDNNRVVLMFRDKYRCNGPVEPRRQRGPSCKQAMLTSPAMSAWPAVFLSIDISLWP